MATAKEFTVTVGMQPSYAYNKAIAEVSATYLLEEGDVLKDEVRRATTEIANIVGPKAQELVTWLAEQNENQRRGA